MTSIVITSFFTKKGVPQFGLQPIIRIWEVSGTDHTLVIGAPDGTGDPGTGIGTDGEMVEVKTAGTPISQDGFYKFEFTDTMGYDPTKTYITRADGGSTIPFGERYQSAEIDSADALTQADINNINTIVVEILKYHKNRTLIDENNFTLTIFDDDGTTPIRVFDLKDENGVASITSIFERLP